MTDMLEWLKKMPSALDTKMGLEILELSGERAVGRMPVQGNTQPIGYWHGGATCVLAETLASIASCAYGISQGKVGLGIDINATHHRSATRGGSPVSLPPWHWVAGWPPTRWCSPMTRASESQPLESPATWSWQMAASRLPRHPISGAAPH